MEVKDNIVTTPNGNMVRYEELMRKRRLTKDGEKDYSPKAPAYEPRDSYEKSRGSKRR